MVSRATSAKVARSSNRQLLIDEIGDWSTGAGPLFRQLARAIARGIDRGALPRGDRLPAERDLAAALHLSRGTVVAAYERLVSDGLLERHRGSGTFVAGVGTLGLPAGREGSALVHRLVDRSSMSAPHIPSVIDLSLSVIHDAADLPSVSLSTKDFLSVAPDTGYSPWGLSGLRTALAARVTAWGLATSEHEVVITTGAQQAISAAAACWVRPGDRVVVEDPTYPGALSAFAQAGARLVAVPMDRHGVRLEPLREALATHPALVYLQPTLHSPTGVILSDERRRRIAAMLARSGVPLVEDMALADLAWTRSPPPVAAYCAPSPAAVIGSLSKLFWGGLRVGWVRAPEAVALRFARVKATHDLGSSTPSQLLAERLLAAGFARFVEQRRKHLRQRYHVMAAALAEELPAWRWQEPAGGLSIWVQLPGADAEAFARLSLAHGVAVAPAARVLSSTDAHADHLRLSFSAPPGVLVEGVRRLASAWRAT